MTTEIDPSRFRGIYWSDSPALPVKLGNFALAGEEQSHQLVDFDGCMTDGSLDSWGVMHELLSPDGQNRDKFLNEIYYTRHKEGQLDDYEAVRWWTLTLDNFVEDRKTIADTDLQLPISLAEIEDGAKQLRARPGMQRFFSLPVPTVVMSAGIGDVIRPFLQQYRLQPRVVMANWLQFCDGFVDGYDKNDLIHINNKQERAHGNGEITGLQEERPFIYLAGDGSMDPQMSADPDRTLALCVGMPQDLTPDQRDAFIAKRIREGYDGVSGDGTFRPLHRTMSGLLVARTVLLKPTS